MSVDLRLLGPLEAVSDDGALSLGGPQQRRLLAMLALRAGRCVSVDDVVAAVWPGEPAASAGAAVQAYVSRLRSLLGPATGRPGAEVLISSSDGYTLAVEADAVDVLRFDALVEQGLCLLHENDPGAAARVLREAARLWRGPLLGDLELAGPLVVERQRLAAAHLAAMDACYDAELALGRASALMPELLQRLAATPLHEPAYLQLMAALDQSGRQADALQVYSDARRRFRAELGTEPGERLGRLHEQLLRRASGRGRRGGPQRGAPLSPLVGREPDVAALAGLLRSARLVTVTGPAGAGKTRLAVELASRLDQELADGASVVELAPASTGADVARAVALAVGVLEQPGRDLTESIAESLSARDLLLVLDNCEHAVGDVAVVVTTMLTGAAGLRVLATSQEALRVDGEHVYRLAPLDVPSEGASTREIEQAPAGQLFVQRARAAQQGFTLTGRTSAAVAQVCRELDGLPLALELAASSLAVVDLEHLAEQLPHRFRLLSRGTRTAHPRHRSLQAAVDWSYELLTDDERELFHQLSVFSGGFALDAVEEVCRLPAGCSTDVLTLLASLVDKSFLQADRTRSRFTLLETLRLYGAQRLAAHGADEPLRDRHAQWVLRLCGRAAPELRGPAQLEWITRLDAERDNVAAALGWSVGNGSTDVAMGIVSTLWWYWWRNGHIPEGAQWAERVLAAETGAAETGAGVPPELRAAVLVGTSHLWWKLGAFEKAEPACAQALELVAEQGTSSPLYPAARGVLAMVARDRGDLATARELLGDCLERYVAQGEQWGEAATLNMLVSVDRDSADLDVAVVRLARSTEIFDRLGDAWGQAWSAWLTGRVATRQGDLEGAAATLRHSVVLAGELGHVFGVVLGIAGVAGVAAAGGHFVEAARLLGATDAYEQAMGVPVRAIEREDSVRDVAVTRAALGSTDYRQHWAAGCALPQAAAVQEALTCALHPPVRSGG